MLVAVALGVPLGLVAALGRNSWLDVGSMAVALLGVSMPSFWLGLLLIFVFSLHLGWFPATGGGDLAHLVLPAVTLGAIASAIIARLTRSSMLEVLGQDYVRTARAKGLAWWGVVVRHALKNALIPVITIFGLQFGNLLAGAVIVETVFSRPGLGRLIVGGILAKDFPLVQGAVLFVATALRADQCARRHRLWLRRSADPRRLTRPPRGPAWRAGSPGSAARMVGAAILALLALLAVGAPGLSLARSDPHRAARGPAASGRRATSSAPTSSAATWRAGCSTAPASR